ncbi:MAG: hypothetical protein WC365_08090 [Candidatus Babeliales bacterium]|jgi:hypothetical protein
MIPFNLTEAKDTGMFACGTSQSGKSTLMKHIVKTIVDAGINVYVIDVSGTWTDCSPISNVVTVQPGDDVDVPANQSAILDLAQLGYTERVNYVIAFCQALYDWHKKYGFKKAPFEFIFFEEAHTYFSNGCFRSPRKFSPCIDIVTVGANFNLRFGAITQFPAMLDKALVKITQQRYFGFTTENNDLNYVKGFVGKEHTDRLNKDGTPNLNSVFNLQKGQFLYQLRNRIEKIQSSKYESPMADFTLNGQHVEFAFNL